MNVWGEGKRGRLFLPGRDEPDAAADAAKECGKFVRDYEEECFSDGEVSCYNCRYRRWTSDSFKKKKKTV